MLRPWIGFTFAMGLLASACGPQVAIGDDVDTDGPPQGSSDDASAPSPSGSGPPPATTGPTEPPPGTSVGTVDEGDVDTGDGSSAESGSFITEPDTCGIAPEGTSFHCSIVECDPFLQDCPEGEKCMPWANDGGPVWNAYHCTPLANEPQQVNESCTVEGSAITGIDDCELGLMCFWVDPETNQGTCVPWCEGTAAAPMCPDGSTCTQSAGGVLALCLGDCDPILDDCASGHCMWLDDAFGCVDIDLGEIPPGAACEFVPECASGSTCLPADTAGDCGGASCCASYCDLGLEDPSAVCGAGQVCTPWWTRGDAPEPWAHVGVCTVPQ